MLSSNRNPLVLASSTTRPGLTNNLTVAGPAAQLAVPRTTISGFSGFSISPGPPRPRGLDAPTTNVTTIAYNNANAAVQLRPPAAQQLAPPLPLLMGSSDADGPVVNFAPGSLLGSYRDPRPAPVAPPISSEGEEGATSSSGAAGDEVAHEDAQHHHVQDLPSSLGPDVGVRSAAANASEGGAGVPGGRQTENNGPNTNTVGFSVLPPLVGMTTSGSVSPPLPRPPFLFNNEHDAGSSPSPVDSDITVTYEAFRFSPVDSLEDLRGSRRNSLNMNLARAPGAWSPAGAEAIDVRHNLSSASPEAERRAFFAHDPLSGTSSGSGTASVLVPPTGISMPEPNIPMDTMRPWGWSATQESDRLTGDLPPPRLNLVGSSSSASLAVGVGTAPGATPGRGPDAEAERSHVVGGGGETSSQHGDAPRGDQDQEPSRAAQNGGAQMNEDETASSVTVAEPRLGEPFSPGRHGHQRQSLPRTAEGSSTFSHLTPSPALRQLLFMRSHQVPPNPVFDRLMEETRWQLNNIIGNDSIRARLPPYTYFPLGRTAAQVPESSQLDHAQNQDVERPNTTSFSPPPGPPLTQRQTLPLSYARSDLAAFRRLIHPTSSTSLQTPDVAQRPPDRSPPPILYSRGGAELQQNNPGPGLNGLLDGDSPISDSIEEGQVWGWSPTDDLLRQGGRIPVAMADLRNAISNVDAGNNPLSGAALEQSARQRFVLAGRTTTADGGPSLEREDEHELRPGSFNFTGPAASRRPFVAQTPSPTRQAQERTANEIKARIELLEAVVESAGTTVVDATEENDYEQDPAPSAEVEDSSASSSSSSGHHHGRKDYPAGGSSPTSAYTYTSCPAQFLLSSEGDLGYDTCLVPLQEQQDQEQVALDFDPVHPSTRTTTTTTTAAASKELDAHQEEPSVVCSEASTAGGARRAEADRRNIRLAAQLVESGLLTQAISDLKALHDRLRETTEQQLCVICLDKPREFGFGPCNHLCCCRGCLMRHVANDRFTSMLEAPGVGNRGQLPERNRVDENGVHPILTCPICTQQAKEWFRVFT